MPRKGFENLGTAVLERVYRSTSIYPGYSVYSVTLSADLADPNPFRGTHCIQIEIKPPKILIYVIYLLYIVHLSSCSIFYLAAKNRLQKNTIN